MSEHTPGFYAIQLHRIKQNQDNLRTALAHTPKEYILDEYNANLLDLLGASVRHHLGTDDKIDAAHDMAYEYIKMSPIKQWLFNKKQRIK